MSFKRALQAQFPYIFLYVFKGFIFHMVDTFDSHAASITAPPSHAAPVVPSDTSDLPFVSRALYVGTPGDVHVITHGGQDITYKALSGTKILRVARVMASGTTAADIIAEW